MPVAQPNIIWFASYPKSGNTWMRLFHKALNHDRRLPFDTKRLVEYSTQCTSMKLYRKVTGEAPSVRTYGDVMKLRVPFQKAVSAAHQGRAVYLKTHSHNFPVDGINPIDRETTALAVILIRNPFDVVASRLNHYDGDRENLLKQFNSPMSWSDPPDRDSFPVMLGSWRKNVHSWLVDPDMPKIVLRYEDLLADDGTLWGQVARNIFCVSDEAQIRFAIDATRFDNLRQEESRSGFEERPESSARFFFRGETGYGAEILTRREKKLIWRENGALAECLGYHYEGGALRIGEPDYAALQDLAPDFVDAA